MIYFFKANEIAKEENLSEIGLNENEEIEIDAYDDETSKHMNIKEDL